ncbi:glycosyltransferase [Rhodobacter xanthinilyticus]|uniref:glycosyltransferase n=1 Tax=Rhodobacter xanthinilyticus TaxID=1850250 RepID=UPI0009F59479|nr:glycosyltransferase [Rhodobacter xanthinilyticus]
MSPSALPPHGSARDVAIVHDWLPTIAGGEKVVAEMVRAFPKSEIYTLFDFLTEEERRGLTGGRPVHVSALNRLPGVRRYYRYLLLQCTRAIEAFDVTHHEVVLSSSAALAKGVLTSPDQKHFAYVHSPARYAWDLTHEYIATIEGFAQGLKRAAAREMMHRFRIWDQRTPPLVDQFIANSDFIRKRIWKVYRREAEVIYPPVDIDAFSLSQKPREDFFFTASRMVPYKRIPMIVEAFSSRPDLRLVVSGDGPDMARVRALAGPNVTLLGHVSQATLIDHLQRCRGFVFAAMEDFGIAPVEAQACGAPVVALGAGGTAETVRGLESAAPTGVHFEAQTPQSLLAGVDRLIAEEANLRPSEIRANAEGFSPAMFRTRLTDLIEAQL